MKLFSPSCGLIYNMLKNSKSVTLFVIFFQKKITPAFTGAIVKGNHNYNKQAGFISRKECMFFIFIFIGSRLYIICGIIVRIDYRPAAR